MSDQSNLSPARIMGIVNAHQASAALKGALELGLFSALGSASKTAADLSQALGASERGIRILCDFLVIQELLEKDGDHYISAPDAARFLDENSPSYFGTVAQFMLSSHLADPFSESQAQSGKAAR